MLTDLCSLLSDLSTLLLFCWFCCFCSLFAVYTSFFVSAAFAACVLACFYRPFPYIAFVFASFAGFLFLSAGFFLLLFYSSPTIWRINTRTRRALGGRGGAMTSSQAPSSSQDSQSRFFHASTIHQRQFLPRIWVDVVSPRVSWHSPPAI